MNQTRKLWNIVGGAGSQTDALDEHILLANGLIEISNKIKKEFSEDF